MSFRLLALAVVAVSPAVAYAGSFSVTSPVDGCTYAVWAPSITVTEYGGRPGYSIHGGYGQSVDCP